VANVQLSGQGIADDVFAVLMLVCVTRVFYGENSHDYQAAVAVQCHEVDEFVSWQFWFDVLECEGVAVSKAEWQSGTHWTTETSGCGFVDLETWNHWRHVDRRDGKWMGNKL
jgi:hypothetical protein